MEQLWEPKTNAFFSGRKSRRTEFGRQPYHDPSFFKLFLDSKLSHISGTQQREDGSTMRYAKALPRDFCFLPGLHGSHRTGASQPMQNDTYASRWEGCLQVSCFPLAGCVDLVHQQLSPRRRLPSSSSTRQKLWLRNIAAALISRHNHNNHVPTARGDAWGVPGG